MLAVVAAIPSSSMSTAEALTARRLPPGSTPPLAQRANSASGVNQSASSDAEAMVGVSPRFRAPGL